MENVDMKRIVIVFGVTLLVTHIIQAQETIYLSNLGQPSTGSLAVGSNSWLAAGFVAGNNASGYTLDSIQLGMTDAAGTPSGFTVMLYNRIFGAPLPGPGGKLVTLNGSLNPVTAGTYTYIAPANFTLTPNAHYFIVLTAGTAVADGAYGWSVAGASSYNPSDGWSLDAVWTSINGSGSLPDWESTSAFPQFAINASAIPEPGVLGLSALGGLLLVGYHRILRARVKH
jgi:hypothetical protein